EASPVESSATPHTLLGWELCPWTHCSDIVCALINEHAVKGHCAMETTNLALRPSHHDHLGYY
uniref:Tick transposon n=1 Tax=Steinernema glaseri TaxID=37863 RepID=A0A1I7Y0C4_9BILA